MSTKKIPVRTIVTCDRCGASKDGGFGRRGMEARLREWHTSYQGDTAGGSRELDFCGDCADDFCKWLSSRNSKDNENTAT